MENPDIFDILAGSPSHTGSTGAGPADPCRRPVNVLNAIKPTAHSMPKHKASSGSLCSSENSCRKYPAVGPFNLNKGLTVEPAARSRQCSGRLRPVHIFPKSRNWNHLYNQTVTSTNPGIPNTQLLAFGLLAASFPNLPLLPRPQAAKRSSSWGSRAFTKPETSRGKASKHPMLWTGWAGHLKAKQVPGEPTKKVFGVFRPCMAVSCRVPNVVNSLLCPLEGIK